MEFYVQFFVNGLITGSIYAVIAAGFSLIYNTHKFVHFAHGGIVMVGGYLFYTLLQTGMPVVVAALLATLLSGFIASGLYEAVYAVLYKKAASNVIFLLAGIALLLFLQNTLQLFYGAQAKLVHVFTTTKTVTVFGAIITHVQIGVILFSGFLFVLLYLIMARTYFGRMMRAVADNSELALVVGIPCERIKRLAFFLGSCIGGFGGVLISLQDALVPSRGTHLIIKGFTGAVIGGMESVPASIIGSYLLGLIENGSIVFLPSEYKLTISFLLLFLFLSFSPGGLYALVFKERSTH